MADSFPTASGADPGSFPHGPEPADGASSTGTGLLLFRRYRIERELGRGGMGRVMLAHDTALDILVAVKLVPELVAKDTDAVNDLRKEVLRGMALMHPGIVRTHNFERDEDGAGIVMEYIEGDTLGDLKSRQPGGCFDPEQLLPWLDQLCAVLDYAHHDARIVHRDLKPRNVMLTREGRIKVADFGIAATLSDSQSRNSMEGVNSGTPPYMSPQQAQGKRPTALDDVYALGATLYELLTGRPPFFRGNILFQVLGETPPPMADRREELDVRDRAPIPPTWEDTIAACLAKERENRPQSAGEVLARLRGNAPHETLVGAGTPSVPELPTVTISSPAANPTPAITVPPPQTTDRSATHAGGTSLPAAPPPLPVPPLIPPPLPAPRPARWPWAAGLVFIGLAVGAAIYFASGPHTDPNTRVATPPASTPAPPPPIVATATPAPAPVTSQTGTLVVNSVPSGATVFVEGQRLGVTPLVRTGVAPGPYRLQIEADGYLPQNVAVVVEAGATRDTGAIQLVAKSSPPTVASTPASTGGYLFPDWSRHRLTRGDLAIAGLSKDMIWRARNEIYARHGLIFSSDRGRALAHSLGDAYRGTDPDQDRVYNRMSPLEQANVELLKALENER